MLSFLPEEYHIFNDIYLEINEVTTQIDHLVISNYGIFVIETKNYSGWIYGGDNSEYWTQNMYGNKYKFYNPIKQNLAHMNILENILKIPKYKFIPIVVFAGDAELKVNSKNIIIHLLELERFILNYNLKIFNNSDIEKITEKLKNYIIFHENIEDKHIRNIKKKIKQKEEMINYGICPKCKTKLVEKNGRYGKFIGCSSFPKCRFILKKL